MRDKLLGRKVGTVRKQHTKKGCKLQEKRQTEKEIREHFA